MKIEKIEIRRLYGKYGFLWNLHDDVNVLAGDNGSFKSTLLRIMTAMCAAQENPLNPFVQVAEMNLSHDYRVVCRKGDPENPMLIDGAMLFCGKKRLSLDDFRKACKFDSVVTFDVPSMSESRSALDSQLDKLESEYAYYLSDLSKQLSDMIMRKGNVDKEDYEKIYEQNSLFISIIDDAFRNTGKSVDREQSKLQFILNGKPLMDNKKLSSGEKQYIIVMLTVLLQRRQESILIMDEPEVSMHVDWQRGLIGNIRKLNPNAQVIIATHSPGVVMDGWEQMITNVSDIMTVQE